ncbi:hypothetical protein ElyMa_002960700 [Elysia marginata]|uniref:Uncharacterized protein n=1 Tax=Elysia marginata TaxID=1093978 RepID=A0AAV4I9K0_9GAST|nr:hypothetical protein ElyMa_002960700 [Elysia marginata]
MLPGRINFRMIGMSVAESLLTPYSPFRGTTKQRFDARSILPNKQTWFKICPFSYSLRTSKVSSTSTPTPPIVSWLENHCSVTSELKEGQSHTVFRDNPW